MDIPREASGLELMLHWAYAYLPPQFHDLPSTDHFFIPLISLPLSAFHLYLLHSGEVPLVFLHRNDRAHVAAIYGIESEVRVVRYFFDFSEERGESW